jgi:hypothetical protein
MGVNAAAVQVRGPFSTGLLPTPKVTPGCAVVVREGFEVTGMAAFTLADAEAEEPSAVDTSTLAECVPGAPAMPENIAERVCPGSKGPRAWFCAKLPSINS